MGNGKSDPESCKRHGEENSHVNTSLFAESGGGVWAPPNLNTKLRSHEDYRDCFCSLIRQQSLLEGLGCRDKHR